MRVVPFYEKKQRGCQYCLHVQTVRHEGEFRTACPFTECPYHVLDKYDSYEEFMESEDSKIPVTEFFTTVAGFDKLAKYGQSPKKIFSDGDDRVDL